MSSLVLIQHNIEALAKARSAIVELSTADYRRQSEQVFTASAGSHIRHIIEHYQQFIIGIPKKYIDYDQRRRDDKIEQDSKEAIAVIGELENHFKQLADDIKEGVLDEQLPLQVSHSTSTQGMSSVLVNSTLSRELLFLHSHMVHHCALIVVILEYHGVRIDNKLLGIAPSTQIYLGKDNSLNLR